MFSNDMTPAKFLVEWLDHPLLPPKEQTVFDHYYRSYKLHFGEYIQAHFDALTNPVRDFLLRREMGLSVLDIGCGCGTETLLFSTSSKRPRVTGLDLSEKYLQVARSRLDIVQKDLQEKLDCKFLSSSIFDLPNDSKFDVVWMSQTFHHVEPREKFVPLVANFLNPGGLLVIADMNAWNPAIQLSVIRQRGFKPIRIFTTQDGKEHLFAHERITTSSNLARLFRGSGIEKVSVNMQRVFPNYPISDNLMMNIEKLIPSILSPAFSQYIYVGRKVDT